tara:strand:- start:6105 stop:6383 length:279 start_codon:yes stop_codon:yes gene_type:complete
MNKEKLKLLCETIEKMHQKEHVEILKIIKNSSSNIQITENSNGCFINMDTLDAETVDKIDKYVIFLKQKEKELHEQEITKNILIDSLNDLRK